MSMEHVEEVYGRHHVAAKLSHPLSEALSWRYGVSNIRLLELVNCHIDSASMEEIVSNTPHLEVLRYSHLDTDTWRALAFEARDAIAAIGNFLGGTLKELAISFDDPNVVIATGVTSMKEFSALRILELDVEIFCAPDGDDGDEYWNSEEIPCLTDILPENVQEVDLYTPNTDLQEWYTALLRRLLPDTLPTLGEELPDCELRVWRPAFRVNRIWSYEVDNESDKSRGDPEEDMDWSFVGSHGGDVRRSAPQLNHDERPHWKQAFHRRFGRTGDPLYD